MDKLLETVQRESEGTTIKASADSTGNILSADVQAAITGKDITIEITLENNITWIVNGNDLASEQREDIKLDIEYGEPNAVGTIPEALLGSMGEAAPFKVVVLAHNGTFQGKVQLNFPMGTANAGKHATLFYYNEATGELEEQGAVVIDTDGIAQFEFEHASQYVIYVGEEKAEPTPVPEQPEDDNNEEASVPQQPKNDNKAEVPVSPKTGNGETSDMTGTLAIAGGAVFVILGIAAALILRRKKFPHT